MNAKQLIVLGGVAAFIAYLLYQKSRQTYAPGSYTGPTLPSGAPVPRGYGAPGTPATPAVLPTSQLTINQNPDLPIAPFAVGTPLDPATVASGGILQSDPYTIWN